MIHNLGSVNIDHVHRVPRFPAPGETLPDTDYAAGLGGKGANQSIAIARAGGSVRHMGGVGADALWARDRLASEGIDVSALEVLPVATGHAVILVTPDGENTIVIHAGANRALEAGTLRAALAHAAPGDWFLTQAETSLGPLLARQARELGLRVAYAAAPFDAESAAEMLPLVDLLSVNAGEAAALAAHLGVGEGALPVAEVLVTRGAEGTDYRTSEGTAHAPAFPVEAVDTTGAGDTFLGTFLACRDRGEEAGDALTRASAAAALSVTREGAAYAIPTAAEVDAFFADRG